MEEEDEIIKTEGREEELVLQDEVVCESDVCECVFAWVCACALNCHM